jgi:hypothetical protein
MLLQRWLCGIVFWTAILATGCNALIGNEEHDYAPDTDATVPDGSTAQDGSTGTDAGTGVDGSPRDAAPSADVLVAEAAVAMEAGSSDAGFDAASEEAGMIRATCTVDGGACKPATDCYAGVLTCEDGGGEACAATTALADGTACGTDTMHFCAKGVCGQCNAGADCSSASTPCVIDTIDCSSGTSACAFSRNATEGMACAAGMYCNAGVCGACKVGAACAPTSNPCHLGTVSQCTDGVATCMDTNAAATDGTSCTSGATTGVCSAGTCTACTANTSGACQCPANTLNCGGVCATCATPPLGGVSACSGTTCTFTCTAAGTTTCGNACVTLQTDNNNCGSCANVCGPGTTCSAAHCACNASSGCAGCCSNATTCEPLASESATSCGAAGATCAGCGPNQVCTSGACTCNSAFPTACSGTCANPLTDVNNCGRCGHVCSPGTCANGLCQPGVLASGLSFPTALSITATSIYWTETQDALNEFANGSINVAPLAGGGYTILAAQQDDPTAIAANASGVFWTNANQGGTPNGLLWLPNGASKPTLLGNPTYMNGGPIALTSTNVYWIDSSNSAFGETLLTLPLTSLTPAAVPTAMTLTSTGANIECILAMVTNASDLFLMGTGCFADNGALFASTLSPFGTPTSLLLPGAALSGPYGGARIGIDSKNVYLANSGTSTTEIVSIPIGGGAISVRTPVTTPGGVTVDASNIYWTDAGDGTATGGSVFSMPLTGGTVTTLASKQNVPYDIGLTSTAVYWTNMSANGNGTGSVMMVAKP